MIANKASLLALVGEYPHFDELLTAFTRSCVCQFDETGDTIGQPCSSCLMLTDAGSVRLLQYGRALALQVQGEEHAPQSHAA